MFTAEQSFFVRISDPRFGEIYVTLLLSMGNIGHYWVTTLSLWLVDPLTVKSCSVREAEKLEVDIILNTNSKYVILKGFTQETTVLSSLLRKTLKMFSIL